MNDLDKRIAELKGWKITMKSLYGSPLMVIERPGENALMGDPESPLWSTSDAKAFELVDELTATNGFKLQWNPDTEVWSCEFDVAIGRGRAATRSEAICCAYIAAREWIKEKNG